MLGGSRTAVSDDSRTYAHRRCSRPPPPPRKWPKARHRRSAGSRGDMAGRRSAERRSTFSSIVSRVLFPLHCNYRTHASPPLSRSLALSLARARVHCSVGNKHLSFSVRPPHSSLPLRGSSLSFGRAGRARYIFAMHNITASAAASMSLFAVAMHDGRVRVRACVRARVRARIVAGTSVTLLSARPRPVVNRQSVALFDRFEDDFWGRSHDSIGMKGNVADTLWRLSTCLTIHDDVDSSPFSRPSIAIEGGFRDSARERRSLHNGGENIHCSCLACVFSFNTR